MSLVCPNHVNSHLGKKIHTNWRKKYFLSFSALTTYEKDVFACWTLSHFANLGVRLDTCALASHSMMALCGTGTASAENSTSWRRDDTEKLIMCVNADTAKAVASDRHRVLLGFPQKCVQIPQHLCELSAAPWGCLVAPFGKCCLPALRNVLNIMKLLVHDSLLNVCK